MWRTLPFLILGFACYLLIVYLDNYQPQMMTDILIQVDVFGVTRVGEMEKERLLTIKNLTIPYEEKEVLVNRTVFMGATTEMVHLALGAPKKEVTRPWPQQKTMLLYWVYYLPNDHRPTVLVFNDHKLIYAYKDSALEWNGSN
jgi:hypothetical protein